MQDISIHISDLHKPIAPRLKELIESAVRLRMAVAYWTIKKDYLSNNLVNLLSKEDSFACIDLSYPTKVSEVCDLASHGARTYFYLRKIKDDPSNPDGHIPHLAGNLLHSKVLLFDLPDSKASIWIGSHNWTDRALSGINIETSAEIKTTENSPVYKQIESLLFLIKDKCREVNPNLKEIYENIQGKEKSFLYLHSVLSEEEALYKKRFFHFLGLNQNELNDFPAKRNVVLFLSEDLDCRSGYICEAQVTKSGLLPRINPSLNWPNLEDGYWSLQETNGSYGKFRDLAYLGEVDKLKSSFYATIFLKNSTFRKIQDIDDQLSTYKAAIDIPQLEFSIPLEQVIEDSLWPQSQRKRSISFHEPQIFNSNISDYKSPLTPGKIAKVIKLRHSVSKPKDCEQER